MLPPTLELSMMRGDSKTYTFALTDADGDALDLAAASVWFTAKRRLSDADDDAVFNLSVGTGITIGTPASGGEVTVDLPAANTTALPDRRTELRYDLQVKLAGGEAQTALYGTLAVYPDVTLAT